MRERERERERQRQRQRQRDRERETERQREREREREHCYYFKKDPLILEKSSHKHTSSLGALLTYLTQRDSWFKDSSSETVATWFTFLSSTTAFQLSLQFIC